MKRKIHLKRKYHLNIKNKIAIIIFIIIFSLIFTIYRIGKKASPIILNYGETEAEKISNIIISNSISKKELKKFDLDKLFIIKKNADGEIQTIDFDSINTNKIIIDITSTIQRNLKYIEKGKIENTELDKEIKNEFNSTIKGNGVFYELPLGVIFGNPMLSNIGPKIPVKFSLIGNIIANLESNIKNYGINNALFEIKMKLELTEKIILPISSKKIKIVNELPIAVKLIQGTIPSYYFNNKNNSDSLTIPVE